MLVYEFMPNGSLHDLLSGKFLIFYLMFMALLCVLSCVDSHGLNQAFYISNVNLMGYKLLFHERFLLIRMKLFMLNIDYV